MIWRFIVTTFLMIKCGYVNSIFPSCNEQKQIVDLHNKWRTGIENGTNIIKMRYNHSLAEQASLWTKLCDFEHDKLDATFGRVGQNLYATSNKVFTWSAVIDAWGNEKKDFIYHAYDDGNASSYCKATMCGHYTQVVWAGSYEVGCAFVKCPSLMFEGKLMTNGWTIACDYFPAGNVPGMLPYEKTACPVGFDRAESGLCSNNYTDNSPCTYAGEGIPNNAHVQAVPSYFSIIILTVGILLFEDGTHYK